MVITIKDDFDLDKIVNSGQCFRPCKTGDFTYRFITGQSVLFIKILGEDSFEISCSKEDWETVWIPYFDLETNYRSIRNEINKGDIFMYEASRAGAGIRILKQEPFETLISFIISQRKNIPAIRSSVEKLCSFYGKKDSFKGDEFYYFPTASEIKTAGYESLSSCSLGYRLAYIEKAVEDIAANTINLAALENLSDDELLAALMSFHGVGIKVASCVALFAYNRGAIAPVDTWINRVIQEQYGGTSPFPGYGDNGGIYQQYAFYVSTNPVKPMTGPPSPLT